MTSAAKIFQIKITWLNRNRFGLLWSLDETHAIIILYIQLYQLFFKTCVSFVWDNKICARKCIAVLCKRLFEECWRSKHSCTWQRPSAGAATMGQVLHRCKVCLYYMDTHTHTAPPIGSRAVWVSASCVFSVSRPPIDLSWAADSSPPTDRSERGSLFGIMHRSLQVSKCHCVTSYI